MSLFQVDISDLEIIITVGDVNPRDAIKQNVTPAESPESDSFCFFYHSVITARDNEPNKNDWVRNINILKYRSIPLNSIFMLSKI